MSKRAPRTVLEVCIAKGGIRKGMRVATFIAQWTIAQQALGEPMSLEEAAAWWKERPSTWYDRLRDFREIFDLAEYPTAIAATAIVEGEARTQKLSDALGQLSTIRADELVTT